ncbi:MAG: DUF3054 domain-containing protein [Propionibacterium sp.]|nr:DUF3054 domain-containing protein [Propionibacterium sp.]
MRVVPLAVDLIFVLIFAAIGRASHGLSALGILATAWPFLLACLVAWVIVVALGDQGFDLRSALVVWLVTWLGGIGLRLVSGTSAEAPFIVVAGLVLALVLWGWRLVRFLVTRRRRTA